MLLKGLLVHSRIIINHEISFGLLLREGEEGEEVSVDKGEILKY